MDDNARHYIRFQSAGLPLEYTSETSADESLPKGFVFAYSTPTHAFSAEGPLGGGWAGFDPGQHEVLTFTGSGAYDPGDIEGVAVKPKTLLRRESVTAWVHRMTVDHDSEVRAAAQEWLEDQAAWSQMTENLSCPETETDLTTDEAHAIVEPYFFVVLEQFLDAGFDRLRSVQLRCRRWVHNSPRHFAACFEDGSEIVVAPELAELGYDTVCAMLAHELGHATDFCYPAEFVLQSDGSILRRAELDLDDPRVAKQWRKWQRGWKERDTDTVEITADAIAEQVMGVPIGYRGPCLLQSFEGEPRPIGLR